MTSTLSFITCKRFIGFQQNLIYAFRFLLVTIWRIKVLFRYYRGVDTRRVRQFYPSIKKSNFFAQAITVLVQTHTHICMWAFFLPLCTQSRLKVWRKFGEKKISLTHRWLGLTRRSDIKYLIFKTKRNHCSSVVVSVSVSRPEKLGFKSLDVSIFLFFFSRLLLFKCICIYSL